MEEPCALVVQARFCEGMEYNLPKVERLHSTRLVVQDQNPPGSEIKSKPLSPYSCQPSK